MSTVNFFSSFFFLFSLICHENPIFFSLQVKNRVFNVSKTAAERVQLFIGNVFHSFSSFSNSH